MGCGIIYFFTASCPPFFPPGYSPGFQSSSQWVHKCSTWGLRSSLGWRFLFSLWVGRTRRLSFGQVCTKYTCVLCRTCGLVAVLGEHFQEGEVRRDATCFAGHPQWGLDWIWVLTSQPCESHRHYAGYSEMLMDLYVPKALGASGVVLQQTAILKTLSCLWLSLRVWHPFMDLSGQESHPQHTPPVQQAL